MEDAVEDAVGTDRDDLAVEDVTADRDDPARREEALAVAGDELARARRAFAEEQVRRERAYAQRTASDRAELERRAADLDELERRLEEERRTAEEWAAEQRAELEADRAAVAAEGKQVTEERERLERLLSRRGRREAIAAIEEERERLNRERRSLEELQWASEAVPEPAGAEGPDA